MLKAVQIFPSGGGVSSVTASAPVTSSGGATPNIAVNSSSAATANFLAQRDGSGNCNFAQVGCSSVSNTGNYNQAYGQNLFSLTSGGGTSHMMSYQTWNGSANTLVVGNTFGDLVLATGGGTMTGKMRVEGGAGFMPEADDTYSLGKSGARWSTVWAANGTIQTSDARQKKDVAPTDLGLDFIASLKPVSYKWIVGKNVEVVEEIGEIEVDVVVGKDEDGNDVTEKQKQKQYSVRYEPVPGVRTHYGLLAQDVQSVLDGKDFGGFIEDSKTGHLGLRYDQFIAPLIKAIQELKAEFDAYKASHP
jgi:hypothetical protein